MKGRARARDRAASKNAAERSARDARGASMDERGIRALWIGLAALLAVRALLTFVPSMWLWSLNTIRFVEPALGWITWAVAALVLLPPIVGRLRDVTGAFGDRIARGDRLAVFATAAVVALGVFLLPDRIRFLGDSYLRREIAAGQGTLDMVTGAGPGQFLPLDAFLHFHLPRMIAGANPDAVDLYARGLGALVAFVFVWVAVAFVRGVRLTGGAAVAGVSVIALGGTLALFTGYAKSTAEMAVLTAGIATASFALVRDGRGGWAAALGLAVAIALHRSSILLVPAAAWGFACAVRRNGARGALPLLVPLAVTIWVLPRVVGIISGFDREHHMGLGASGVDLANVLLQATPILPAVLVGWLLVRGTSLPMSERIAWGLLGVPAAALFLLFRPVQGMFRDWEVFTIANVIVSLAAANALGAILEGRRAWAGLGAAAAIGTAVPTLQLLVVTSDIDRSLARIEASVTEPPTRPVLERARTWDFLGVRNEDLERWDATARAFAQSEKDAPNLRVIAARAHAEEQRENWAGAQEAYRELAARAPDGPMAWEGLHRSSVRLRDFEESWRSARELARLHPGDESYRLRFAFLDSVRRTMPGAVNPGSAP